MRPTEYLILNAADQTIGVICRDPDCNHGPYPSPASWTCAAGQAFRWHNIVAISEGVCPVPGHGRLNPDLTPQLECNTITATRIGSDPATGDFPDAQASGGCARCNLRWSTNGTEWTATRLDPTPILDFTGL